MKLSLLFILLLLMITPSMGCLTGNPGSGNSETEIITGADQPEVYLPMLKGKKVGLVVNHTAIAGNMLLPDYLIGQGVDVQKIFAPEHGFRGEAAAGEVIRDGKDPKTGIRVFSLYGDVKKPTREHMEGLDIIVFDIQDVGCRFYTYLSTLYYCIESCAEFHVPLLVLDRPNPNGDYVAGPVRKHEFISFVGMVPVPIVHGCTLGEMAMMINGEGWPGLKANIEVVKVRNYSHADHYELPVSPSPNLPNQIAVRLYPSLCFFEATSVSIGRGTAFPFQVIGGTLSHLGDFSFTPENMPGFAVNPVNMNKKCFGVDLRDLDPIPPFTLKYFIDFYNNYPTESDFLTNVRWFNLLAGTDSLIKDIRAGKSEAEIVASWEQEINEYKSVRRKYLLYPDFE